MKYLLTSLIQKVEAPLSALALYKHGFLSLLSFVLTRGVNIILDQSYAASQYPVPYFVGQTAFSGEKIKTYFAYMLEQNTLDIYRHTQLIDFLFIAAMFVSGLFISLFLSRLHKRGSWLYRLSILAAILIPLGAVFDASENLISFAMLSQPTRFANWIAYVYSSFALLKFISIGLGYAIWLFSLGGFLVAGFIKLLHRNSARNF